MTNSYFTYPIVGSITNGKIFVVKNVAKNIFTTLRENLYGKPKNFGISIGWEEINFLLSIRFGILSLNKPQKFTSQSHRELTAMKFFDKKSESIRLTQRRENLSISIDIGLCDYFTKMLPFLQNMKDLYELRKKVKTNEQQIIEAITIITYNRIQNQLIADERQNPAFRDESFEFSLNTVDFDGKEVREKPGTAANIMMGSDIWDDQRSSMVLQDDIRYVEKLLGSILPPPKRDLIFTLLSQILTSEKGDKIRSTEIFKCLNFFLH